MLPKDMKVLAEFSRLKLLGTSKPPALSPVELREHARDRMRRLRLRRHADPESLKAARVADRDRKRAARVGAVEDSSESS